MNNPFTEFLRAEVTHLGQGKHTGAGTLLAARICGVTPQTLRLWMTGKGRPNASTEAGARLLLTQARDEAV